jgi:predicted nucleotide-binding protein
MMVLKRRIYVSSPFPDNLVEDRHRTVRAAVIEMLMGAGYEPQEFGVSGIPFEKGMNWTVKDSIDVMVRCRGAVVLAFPRWRFVDEQGNHVFSVNAYNHIEGALALANDVPTLIITSEEVHGVYDVGIIGQGTGKLMAVIPRDGDARWLRSTWFQNLFAAWKRQIEERKDIFFGYCSQAKATALDIIRFLGTLGVSVLDWQIDFTGGASIMQQIEQAAACSLGVFLFTKDDELAGPTEYVAAPRDNVVFEAGYFVRAIGKERVLIIREAGAKMPADLGGDIYLHLKDRKETATIETRLRKFIEDRL